MSQANRLQSTIPSETASPRLLTYLAEVRNPRGFGTYLPEVDTTDTRRDALISDITGGQIENVVRVLCLDIAAGKCTDASAEIAAEVAAQAIDRFGFVPSTLRGFVDAHLPLIVVNALEMEAA